MNTYLDRPEERPEPERAPSSDSPGKMEDPSLIGLQAAREALLNPRQQLRSAVALQIGQLSELTAALRIFQDLMASTGAEWSVWIEGSRAAFEGANRALEDLAQARTGQDERLQTLTQGWLQARDADTARFEAGLRHLASSSQELRATTDAVRGTGQGFQTQVQACLRNLEGRLPALGDQVAERLEMPIQRLRPLTWINAALCLLVALDVLVRVLK